MKKLNTRLKSTFIGCGQCGCQVIADIEKRIMELDGPKDNVSFVGINTSTEDLAAVILSHKIQVKNCNGAAGNRERSLDALAENIDEILEELMQYIIEGSTIFIAFSMGGGTGSAMAPMLARILREAGYTVCLIPVVPADSESLKIRDNARQTFDEIEELKPNLGSIFMLDNNAAEKLQINRTFATLITAVLCINNKSQDGNMDLAEIKSCLHCPSFSIVVATNASNGTTGSIVDILNRESNIFAKRDDKTVTIMGVSEAVSARDSKIDIVELRKAIGTAPTEYHGYLSDSGENVVILSGLMMPYKRIDTLAESVEKEAESVQNSMKALTQVRTARISSVFAVKNQEHKTVSTGMSALEKLKARRISK